MNRFILFLLLSEMAFAQAGASPPARTPLAGPSPPVNMNDSENARKARAVLDGRAAPTLDDVRRVAAPVLRHRVLPNHRAVGDGVGADRVVEQILQDVRA